MRKLRSAFVTGLLVLVPLMATIDILVWFISFLDSVTRSYFPTKILPFDFSGLGLILALIIVLITGVLAQNYMGTWIVGVVDHAVRKFPLVGGLYGAIKKFLETIFNPSSTQFKQAVMVEFPKPGFYSVGFLTGPVEPKLQEKSTEKLINVFIPLVPNPISGFYLLIPEHLVTPLDISIQDAFKIVISMGIVGAEHELKKGMAPHST